MDFYDWDVLLLSLFSVLPALPAGDSSHSGMSSGSDGESDDMTWFMDPDGEGVPFSPVGAYLFGFRLFRCSLALGVLTKQPHCSPARPLPSDYA